MQRGKLPDIFQTQLRQKYHSAKLQEISKRKLSKEPKDSRDEVHRYSSRKVIVQTIQEKHIALENLQLVKRLAQVRFRPAEISKHWGGKEKGSRDSKLSGKVHHRNILQQRQRMTENERLGKSIEIISKRKKKMILPP